MRPFVEQELLEAWKRGENISVGQALRRVAQKSGIVPNQAQASMAGSQATTQHGDHWDHSDGKEHQDKGPVGMVPVKASYTDDHGDHSDHGDHTD
jgi:hypothetical protein